MNGDGPDVDEDVQGQVEHLVEGEEEGVDVVRESLQEAVDWMEGVAGEGSGDLPHVVRFVKQLQRERRGQRETLKISFHNLHLITVNTEKWGNHVNDMKTVFSVCLTLISCCDD